MSVMFPSMRVRAILSKTTTDQIKSRLKSPQLAELVFEVYITPEQFSQLVSKYYDKEFELEIKDDSRP